MIYSQEADYSRDDFEAIYLDLDTNVLNRNDYNYDYEDVFWIHDFQKQKIKKKDNSREAIHREALIALFGEEKASRITTKFNDSYNLVESGFSNSSTLWFDVPNFENVFHSERKEYEIMKRFISKRNQRSNQKTFFDINTRCETRYQRSLLLEADKHFSDFPHVYCSVDGLVIKKEIDGHPGGYKSEIVNLATLAFRVNDVPIRKKYRAYIPKYTVEIMRLSFSDELSDSSGKHLYRVEIMPRSLIDKRRDKGAWGNAKLYGDYYYLLINPKHQICRNLYRALFDFYKGMSDALGIKFCIAIDSHEKVKKLFNVCVPGVQFISTGVLPDRDNIDKQSLIAYDIYGFRLFELLIEGVTKSYPSIRKLE